MQRPSLALGLGKQGILNFQNTFQIELILTICSPRYLALEQLFLSPRPSLQQLPVTGDLVISAETSNSGSSAMDRPASDSSIVIVTRSRAKKSKLIFIASKIRVAKRLDSPSSIHHYSFPS